ncbi:hypothetical protein BDA99DRAFT_589235 [Phascolomyces articulosus]|uniref:Arrestin-like N-terminal domain-containing protein n=1 Tax=Phascolomyces articulosus TaxID=60185 RepID=A0AAD5P9R7_9FUNG|nr:hypothetical protein BDA99DRAFT_589235 [Phascolomyces articulosus]
MPMLYNQKGSVSMQISIDPSFTGILRGNDNGTADPIYLKGTVVVHVHRPIKVRKIAIRFEGRCKVTINTSRTSKLVSAPPPEGVECRNLVTKKMCLLQEQQQPKLLPPGKYIYSFEFELSTQLPATFHGKRGMIRYRLKASIQRSVFSNNLHVYQEIPIRRSLVYDTIPFDLTETIVGKDYPDEIEYTASAPSVVYREGGLVPLNLAVQLIQQQQHTQQEHNNNSTTKTIQSITCALRERITYQTTGQQSLTYQSVSQTDELFPLGWSTFYPSEKGNHAHYNPYKKQEYNAEFRLCPRVNPDIKTKLIKVSHALIVNIKMIDDEQQQQLPMDNNNHHREGEDSYHHQKLTPINSNEQDDQHHQQAQESQVRPNTPPLSRSSSSSSISSIFSLGRHQAINTEEHIKEALLSIGGNGKRRHHHHHPNENDTNIYMCSLEVPIVVTSRQHCGEMPHPPAYQNMERPPTYRQSIAHLPPAPLYHSSST